ncbi:4-hydroxy-2-oxoheptanedioate aldolase, partial [Phenoliferia sp. Uapishka_3]
MHSSVGVIAAHGCSPIVRIAAPTNELVKRALDTGCHGIMVPMMGNAADAATLVSFAKFPVPTALRAQNSSLISGIRGVGSPFAPAVFGQNLGDYISTANQNTMVIVQIESVEGLNNCEEIAKVPGIDMLFIGPNDLCSSMGFVAGDHESIPEVQAAIARILAACKAAGIKAGMFCTAGEQVFKRHEQGFDFMNLGLDILAIGAWNAAELAKISSLR